MAKSDPSVEDANAMLRFLEKRNPAVLGTGPAEFKTIELDSKIFQSSNHIFPLPSTIPRATAGKTLKAIRRFRLGDRDVVFSAVGSVDLAGRANDRGQATSIAMQHTIQQLRNELAKSPADLVIAIAATTGGKEHALSSGLFDAVIHLAQRQTLALPSQDIIDLKGNHKHKLHATPGLIRVSAGDIKFMMKTTRTGKQDQRVATTWTSRA